MPILFPNEVDFRANKIIGEKRGTLCNDKKINLPGRQNKAKHVCTKSENLKLYEAKADRA